MKKADRSGSSPGSKRGPPGPARGGGVWRLLRRLLVSIGVLGVVFGAVVAFTDWVDRAVIETALWYFEDELPEFERGDEYRPRQSTRVYARDGSLIDEWTDGQSIVRTVVPFSAISTEMKRAILAAEDAEFYEHPGYDRRGLMRAMRNNLTRGRAAQGASTITQQLVKMLVVGPERSYQRKIKELLLAYRLERGATRADKDRVLAMYLNHAFFGGRHYGVEAASREYFGKSAAELTLPEAALLAGLVQSPNRYNPFQSPDAARARRSYVLGQLARRGWIGEAEREAADASPLGLRERKAAEATARWYVDAVRREINQLVTSRPELWAPCTRLLEEQRGVTSARSDAPNVMACGLEIHTALDPVAQAVAESALQEGLRGWDARHGWHKPVRVLRTAEERERFHAEAAAKLPSGVLRTTDEFRAEVVSASEEFGVRVRVGDLTAELSPYPETRVRPGGAPWEELFPIGGVYTVRPREDIDRADERALMPTVELLPSAEGAVVVMDVATREVLALVGGYDPVRTKFNRSVQARRQMGSAFKPFVYSAALQMEANHAAERSRAEVTTAATVFQDAPKTFIIPGSGEWRPGNADGKYLGAMSVREALARSRNTIAVEVLNRSLRGSWAAEFEALVKAFGVSSPVSDSLTRVLGSAETTPLELTNAYATIGSGGVWAPPILVTRVEGPTRLDEAGRVRLYEAPRLTETRIPAPLNWLTTSLLRSVVTSGTATRARRLPFETAGKTGTTNDVRDAWFVGFSTQRIAGVWVGRDDNSTLGKGESGGTTALPIWVDVMAGVHAGREVAPFGPPPPGIVTVEVDPATGLRARPGRKGTRTEYFLAGTEPVEFAPDASDRDVTDILLKGGTGAGGTDGDPERGSTEDDHGF